MTGTTPWTAQDNVEPIAAATIGAIANVQQFNVVWGAGATYNAGNLNVAIATGYVTHTGVPKLITAGNVALVADPTNPRWAYTYVNSSGTPSIVMGTAAATPAVPDPGANVTVGLTYIQAALTIANNATYKLDKRVYAPDQTVRIVKSATQTINNSSTLTNDSELFFTMEAATDYEVVVNVRVTSATATPDWKYALTCTGMTWDGIYQTGNIDASGATVTLIMASAQTSGTAITLGSAGKPTAATVQMTFTVHSGVSGGVLNFQWAQSSATAEDTQVLKNSWMEWRKLGAS